jgi:hypothetical protein
MKTRERGGAHDSEPRTLGLVPSEILDFSIDVKPYAPAPALVPELSR